MEEKIEISELRKEYNCAIQQLQVAFTQDVLSQMTTSLDFNPPAGFSSQVRAVKTILKSDVTGLISTIVDFMIDAISSVKFSVETDNKNLTIILNDWLANINKGFRDIPTGFQNFVKEYSRERFTSSLMVTRLDWNVSGQFALPTNIWVLDGESVEVKTKNRTKVQSMGDLKYFFNNRELKEDFYVQKLTRWYEKYPSPYIIKRVYHNYMLKKYLKEKGSEIIKEIMILLLIKKGDKARPDIVYESKDYDNIMLKIKELTTKAKAQESTPTWATGFDTDIQHIIPDLSKILARTIYEEIDRDILSGMGVIDIVQSLSANRYSAVLNPRPLIAQVTSAVDDTKVLLKEIIFEIIDRNKTQHPTYFSNLNKIEIKSTPLTTFWSEKFLTMIRAAFDRGPLSYRTYLESLGFDSKTEEKRRKQEKKEGLEELFDPHPTQVVEKNIEPTKPQEKIQPEVKEKNENEDKTKNEKPDYTNAECPHCKSILDCSVFSNIEVTYTKCLNCGEIVTKNDLKKLIKNEDN